MNLFLKDLCHYFINGLVVWLRLYSQIGKILVQNLLGTWPGSDTPHFYEAPGDFWVKGRTRNAVTNISLVKLPVRHWPKVGRGVAAFSQYFLIF